MLPTEVAGKPYSPQNQRDKLQRLIIKLDVLDDTSEEDGAAAAFEV